MVQPCHWPPVSLTTAQCRFVSILYLLLARQLDTVTVCRSNSRAYVSGALYPDGLYALEIARVRQSKPLPRG